MIPEELKQLKQWIKLPPGQKFTTAPGWEKNPLYWHDIQEPNGRGFLLKGTPYLVIDGDHVLARPTNPGEPLEFAHEWAEQFFTGLLDTFTEISLSGTGLHVIYRLDPASTYGGNLDRLKNMAANGGRFNFSLPGFEHLEKKQRPHVEIFYNAVREICLTDKAIGADTIQEPPPVVNELLDRMEAFIVPTGEHLPATSPLLARQDPSPEYDTARAAVMLDCIDPAGLDYHDWVKVGQILHDMGADISLWDAWSQKDPDRYKGSREITSKWASFKGKGGGATIKTLHNMAKMGGYSEKDFARDWYREHPETVDIQKDYDNKLIEEEPAPSVIRQAEPMNPWAVGMLDLVENVEKGAYQPIPTGVKNFDDLLGGGFMSQWLVTISAPPGEGKSAFSQWLVEQMARNKGDFTALYFCFEMSRPQLQARSIARLLHEHGRELSTLDIMRGAKGWREGVDLYEKETGGRVAYYGMGSGLNDNSLAEMKKIMLEGVKYNASIGRPAPFVVVDYIQLVQVAGKEEQEAIKEVMGSLKKFAVAYNTVVIGVVANNRESNKAREVSMYTGRGSSSLEYGADVCLAIANTDEIGERKPEKVDKTKKTLQVTKGRFLEAEKKADFKFNGAYAEFTPLDRWGEPATAKQSREYDSMFNF